MLALAALLFSVSTSKLRAFFWVFLAIISAVGSWIMVNPRDRATASAGGDGLEAVLDLVLEDDLLLLHSDGFVVWQFQVPADLAGKGLIQTFDDASSLKPLFRDQGIATNHRAVWILLYGESAIPWIKPSTSPDGKLVVVGKAGSNFVLHQFRPEFFPHPVTIFSQGGAAIPVRSIEGLHDDGVWTGPELKLVFDLEITSNEILEITLKGWRPQEIEIIVPKLKVFINEKALVFQQSQTTQILFRIPPQALRFHGNALEIHCPTFEVKNDHRSLGLDLETIILR